jgi:hypothetical protein
MRNRQLNVAFVTLTVLGLSPIASAQVLIDFEGLPIGTVVTNQFPEVSFSSSAGNVNSVTGPFIASGQFICTGPAGGAVTCIEDTYMDFTLPVSDLTFQAVEANCACPDALFRIFQNGVFTHAIVLVGLGGSGNKLVDLSGYPSITRLEIVDILDNPTLENGIGWDEFSFAFNAWTDQSSALPGASGDPKLMGDGSMADGSQNVLSLTNAAPNALAILFVAPSSVPTPFKGGLILPDPSIPPTYAVTSATGEITFRFTMPPGMPSGTEAWLQWGIADAAAVQGVALSNAVKGTSP